MPGADDKIAPRTMRNYLHPVDAARSFKLFARIESLINFRAGIELHVQRILTLITL